MDSMSNNVEMELIEAAGRKDGRKKIVKCLAKEVNIDAVRCVDGQYITALQNAILKRKFDNIRLLLKVGADVNKANTDGITPLMLAVICHLKPEVKMFVKANADLEQTDGRGWTALFYAVHQNSFVLAQYLIKHGAHVDTVDMDGRKPEAYARGIKISRLLHKVSSNVVNESGIYINAVRSVLNGDSAYEDLRKIPPASVSQGNDNNVAEYIYEPHSAYGHIWRPVDDRHDSQSTRSTYWRSNSSGVYARYIPQGNAGAAGAYRSGHDNGAYPIRYADGIYPVGFSSNAISGSQPAINECVYVTDQFRTNNRNLNTSVEKDNLKDDEFQWLEKGDLAMKESAVPSANPLVTPKGRESYGKALNKFSNQDIVSDHSQSTPSSSSLLSASSDPNPASTTLQSTSMASVATRVRRSACISSTAPVDLNARDNSGKNAWHYVAQNDNKEIAELLLKQTTDVNLADNDGCTPLLVATKHNSTQVAKLLIASKNTTDYTEKPKCRKRSRMRRVNSTKQDGGNTAVPADVVRGDLLRPHMVSCLTSSTESSRPVSLQLNEFLTDKRLDLVSEKIGNEQRALGTQLDIPLDTIDQLQSENPRMHKEVTFRMLMEWRKKLSPKMPETVKIKKLQRALSAVNRRDIVVKYLTRAGSCNDITYCTRL